MCYFITGYKSNNHLVRSNKCSYWLHFVSRFVFSDVITRHFFFVQGSDFRLQGSMILLTKPYSSYLVLFWLCNIVQWTLLCRPLFVCTPFVWEFYLLYQETMFYSWWVLSLPLSSWNLQKSVLHASEQVTHHSVNVPTTLFYSLSFFKFSLHSEYSTQVPWQTGDMCCKPMQWCI